MLTPITNWQPTSESVLNIAITSGASCPDATVDEVIQRILVATNAKKTVDEVLAQLN